MKRQWLVDARMKKGYTQDKLSELTGACQSFISALENGTRGNRIAPYAAKKIAKVLEIDWTRFYE